MVNEHIYFHGTDACHVYSIISRGFNLERERWGRGWGNGVYLSGTGNFAATWGKFIIVCKLRKGTRILWHQEYNSKVIQSLQREFGSKITTPEFWKIVPRNKQFTRNEVIHLWHYFMAKYYESKRRFNKRRLERLQNNYSRIYEQLKRHGYDGVGFRDPDWPEILVFNPANVQAVSVHKWNCISRHAGNQIPTGQLKHIQVKALKQE